MMTSPKPITRVIRPKKALSLGDFREMWDFRELMYFLSWKDLKIRYKQTVVGIGWAIFQPFATMVIFSGVFGTLAKIPSDGIPYPIFLYVGLLFWQLFSTTLSDSSNTLVSNSAIVTKVYFPRLILPLADTVSKFVDFFFASLVLVFLMFYYHFVPHLEGILLVPILLFLSTISAMGAGLILAGINVKYRDVRYILPFFIQLLLFVTPVIYPSSLTAKYVWLKWLIAINPMAGVIQAARAGFFGNAQVQWGPLGISFLISLVMLLIGTLYFKKTERYFADIV